MPIIGALETEVERRRGRQESPVTMLAFVDLEERVPPDHPLTHQSATDREARLFQKGKGKEARLVFMAHTLMENRNGLLVDFRVSEATGRRNGIRFRCCWPGRANAGSIPGRSEGTRATTRGVAWGPCAPARGARHERALSMDARPGIAAMPSVSV